MIFDLLVMMFFDLLGRLEIVFRHILADGPKSIIMVGVVVLVFESGLSLGSFQGQPSSELVILLHLPSELI